MVRAKIVNGELISIAEAEELRSCFLGSGYNPEHVEEYIGRDWDAEKIVAGGLLEPSAGLRREMKRGGRLGA